MKGNHSGGSLKNLLFNNVRLSTLAALLSIANTLVFHLPFFRYVCSHVESGLNGKLIIVGLAILMLVANYFAFYLIMYLGRAIGKALVSFFFIGNAVSLYFINTYDVMIDDTMMGNVFNTNTAEATSYYSAAALAYIILLGIVPTVWIFATKLDYGSLKRFFKNIGASLGIMLVIGFANITNWPWVDNNSTVMGSLVLPWSYTVNTFRYRNEQKERNRKEIPLPDATVADDEKEAVVLVIGESARSDHFSILGYERETNPLLAATPNVSVFPARANATYTIGGVKAILDSQESDKLYEILPNYLFRTGVDVIWRTSNWGEPPLHIDNVQDIADIAAKHEGASPELDETLIIGLQDEILQSGKNKVLIILHTSTSHGPSYNKKYPEEFERYAPVSTSVEMSKIPREEIVNAYDNTILYTDYLLHGIISQLSDMKDWKTAMLYVSDHGESLGENNLYMHGVPIKVAPKEQYEIPFIVWTSNPGQKLKHKDELTQFHVFHSVLHLLSIESPIYKEELDIFE